MLAALPAQPAERGAPVPSGHGASAAPSSTKLLAAGKVSALACGSCLGAFLGEGHGGLGRAEPPVPATGCREPRDVTSGCLGAAGLLPPLDT